MLFDEHNLRIELETRVTGCQRVSIVSSFCVLLTTERHGSEKNLSGARAADLPIVGQTLRFRYGWARLSGMAMS